MRVLITGFGPFPGVEANASAGLVRRLACGRRTASLGEAWLFQRVLPVAWRFAARLSRQHAQSLKPHVILHFGVSRLACSFQIERLGSSVCDDLPDCRGERPNGQALPHKQKNATLDVEHTVRSLHRAGIAAELSASAGAYLCNHVLYNSLAMCELKSSPLTGFIHIPEDGAARPLMPQHPPSDTLLLKGARVILAEAERQARQMLRRPLHRRTFRRSRT